jgi:lysophospholipase L1-like esterase
VRALLQSKILLVYLGVTFALFFAEILIRCHFKIARAQPFFTYPAQAWDKELGWRGKEHRLGKDWEAPILVIGDSFTDGLGVKSEEMWFASLLPYLKNKSLIAYGGLGYGNFQELLVLKEYLYRKNVKPSHVFIQLCSNDFLNNYLELEKYSFAQRAPAPRPYLQLDRSIVLMFPRQFAWLSEPLLSYSQLAYRLDLRIGLFLSEQVRKGNLNTIEHQIEKKQGNFEPFQQAVSTTNMIIGEIKSSLQNIPLFLVLVDDHQPYQKVFEDIANNNQIPLIVPLRGVKQNHKYTLPDRVHLSASGNRLMGERLIEKLEEKKYLFLSDKRDEKT